MASSATSAFNTSTVCAALLLLANVVAKFWIYEHGERLFFYFVKNIWRSSRYCAFMCDTSKHSLSSISIILSFTLTLTVLFVMLGA